MRAFAQNEDWDRKMNECNPRIAYCVQDWAMKW